MRRNSLGYLQVDHTGFNHHAGVRQIDLKDAAHFGGANDNAVFYWQCASAQSSARAARHKRNTGAMTNSHDGLDLFCRAWQQNSIWHHTKIGQTVTLVRL